MKYIKSFEQKENGVYWRIDIKSKLHLILALEKLGLTKNDQIYNDIVKDYDDLSYKINYFYILKGITFMNEVYWYYSVDLTQFKNRFKYLGRVKITEFDVKKSQYNL